MNRVNFIQTGGFPWDVNILDFAQQAAQISQNLGEIIAPLAIVRGCVENGNNVSDGIIYINGELLPFQGGLKQEKIRIVETSENRELENGESFNCLISRYATFGSGSSGTYNYADLHRSISNQEIAKRLVHPGFIQDYSGDVNNLPAGWFLCDGTNGTPDLRGMFIVGYDNRDTDYDTVGKTGGLKEVALTVNQMPKHRHNGTTSTDGAHTHTYTAVIYGGNNNFNRGSNGMDLQGTTSSSGSHSHSFETNETGENQAHENRPPYYVLAKIIFKG